MAAERYLLRELSDAERDQFEEHFFDCPACAEDVRMGAIFEANARQVFANQPTPVSTPVSWWEWVRLRPAVAGSLAGLVVLLAGGVGYQSLVTHGLRSEVAELRAPQSFPSVFLHSTTRGAEQVIQVPRASRVLGLSLDLAPGQSFQHYLGEVSGESGKVVFSVPLAPPAPGESLNLLLPVSSLEPGRRYSLVVRGLEEGSTGKPATEIARYYFTMQQN
ncbi:MAG TPA: zf-HC2 domain-containing protein [Bryobacterales bacterium]|nr:zf-HC2 domain-containing protein [Bryobacterales bacterium]